MFTRNAVAPQQRPQAEQRLRQGDLEQRRRADGGRLGDPAAAEEEARDPEQQDVRGHREGARRRRLQRRRRADVFQSVGTLWAYSPSGQREWRFLNGSTTRLGELGLGDFDGDGKTDVFTHVGRRAGSSRPAAPATRPRSRPARTSTSSASASATSTATGKTDVFRANGSQFFFSSGGATAWQPLAALALLDRRPALRRLRRRRQDGRLQPREQPVVGVPRRSERWQRLNRKLSRTRRSLGVRRLQRRQKTDVARSAGGNWQVSRAARPPGRRSSSAGPKSSGRRDAVRRLQRRRQATTCSSTLPSGGLRRCAVLRLAASRGSGCRRRRRSPARPLVVRGYALSMAEFLVEFYVSRADPEAVDRGTGRARSGAETLTSEGIPGALPALDLVPGGRDVLPALRGGFGRRRSRGGAARRPAIRAHRTGGRRLGRPGDEVTVEVQPARERRGREAAVRRFSAPL